jgi:hypothetical protein
MAQETYMTSFDPTNLAVLVLAVGGLAAVLGQLLVKDPRGLFEMLSDSRRFAEAPLAGDAPRMAQRTVGTATPAANVNRPKLAA